MPSLLKAWQTALDDMAQQSGQEQLEAALEVIGGQQPYPHEACQGQPAAASEIKGKDPQVWTL